MAKTTTRLRRPLRRLTQAELDGFLDKAADILRGNVDHSEFRGYVFALLFFKRISDIYEEEIRKLIEELGDEELARDPKMHNFVVSDTCLWDEVARLSDGGNHRASNGSEHLRLGGGVWRPPFAVPELR